MTASTPMSVFHQWLLADPASQASACAIILHCANSMPCARLIQDIADYLNEYDDDGDGRWLPATPELVGKISQDENHRRLLGMAEITPDASANPQAGYRQTLTGLGQRGHVVFRSPGSSDEALDLSNTFHAGIGCPADIPAKCHLILNPALLEQKCMAHIIGDVFLEWHHCEMRRGTPIHEIR
jgi:hypothetical protein